MLFRSIALVAMLALVASPALAEKLTLDKEKSKIDFVGKKTDGAHKGGFKAFKVDAEANVDAPDKSKLKLEIDTTSLWSDDEKLTEHLKNPDFFDVRKYPKITFEMTGMEGVGTDSPTLIGKLTMLDKTAELKVPCRASMNDSEIVLEADFKLDRTKWGMAYGKGKINDEVEIKATLHLER
jgi:polyisoprenoid-binding protein YceI